MNWPQDNLPVSGREAEYGMIIMNECVINSTKLIGIFVFYLKVC
jgi:hypothetical protein